MCFSWMHHCFVSTVLFMFMYCTTPYIFVSQSDVPIRRTSILCKKRGLVLQPGCPEHHLFKVTDLCEFYKLMEKTE